MCQEAVVSEPGESAPATVPLEAVLATSELLTRPARPPNFEAKSRALVALAREMACHPEGILQKLVDAALELCRAESAGVSILERGAGSGVFRWHAVAGRWAVQAGGSMPRDASPCGTVLDRDSVLLFDRPGLHFPDMAAVDPLAADTLLVPFHVDGLPVPSGRSPTHPTGSLTRKTPAF
jgi:hypothetical protein